MRTRINDGLENVKISMNGAEKDLTDKSHELEEIKTAYQGQIHDLEEKLKSM